MVGQSETLFVVVTNSSPTSATISSVTVTNSSFEVSNLNLPKVLAPGESLETSLTFAPARTGWASGEITFATKSNPSLNLAVGGWGVTSDPVTASPASLSFGSVAVGASSTRPVVLTNTSKWNATLYRLQITGTEFSVDGPKFPLTLAGGQSVKLNATFRPQAAGLTAGSVFVPGPGLNIPLSGAAAGTSNPELSISPATLSFGDVAVGSIETLTVGLTANGGSVTISSASSSNSQFAVTGGAFPLTILTGQEVPLNVSFAPKGSGTTSATLSFNSNAAGSTSEPLTGIGTTPFVSLSWIASTSEVKGYNIYRKTSANGPYSKLNSTPHPDTKYMDTTVASDTTYYYATTAVSASGKESVYSNRVEVAVP